MPNNRNNQGTGFVNYNDILNANQASGQRMGQAVAGGLESQANALNRDYQNQSNEFNTNFGNAQNDWSNQSQLANQLAGQGTNQNWTSLAGANTDQAGNPVDLTTAGNNFRNYNYHGPTGYSNASGLQTQAQSALDTGRLAGSDQGEQQLLGQYVGGRGYNQGQSQFDQALLNKYGRGGINQARKQLYTVGNQANTGATGAAQAADTEKNVIASNKEEVGKKLLSSLGSDTDVGGNSVLGQATGQANKFKTSAGQLNDLLQTIQGGNDIDTKAKVKQLQDAGVDVGALLSSAQGMGLDQGDTYYKGGSNYNKNLLGDLIGQYTNTFHTPAGAKYFQGDQQGAAQNLAAFLSDPRLQAIKDSKFDTKVYSPTASALQSDRDRLANEQSRDIGFSNAYNAYDPQGQANEANRQLDVPLWYTRDSTTQSGHDVLGGSPVTPVPGNLTPLPGPLLSINPFGDAPSTPYMGSRSKADIAGYSNGPRDINERANEDQKRILDPYLTQLNKQFYGSGLQNYMTYGHPGDDNSQIDAEKYTQPFMDQSNRAIGNYILPDTNYANHYGQLGGYNRNAADRGQALMYNTATGKGANTIFNQSQVAPGQSAGFANLMRYISGLDTDLNTTPGGNLNGGNGGQIRP